MNDFSAIPRFTLTAFVSTVVVFSFALDADAAASSKRNPAASRLRAEGRKARAVESMTDACPAPRIRIEGKTPVRRGPGLNYPVVQFLETDRCTKYGRISVNRDWVLVDLGELVGWVPTGRLERASRLRIQEADLETTSPVGSGDFRGFVTLVTATPLRTAPRATSEERRLIPTGTRVVPLQMTPDDRFVEIRDDRGERGWIDRAALEGSPLENLPRTSPDDPAVVGATAETDQPAAPGTPASAVVEPSKTATASADETRGLAVEIRAFGLAARPSHRFDSDGADATRRYQLSSFAPGAGLEVGIGRVGPIALRAGYSLMFVLPTGPDGDADNKARGIEQEAFLRVGLPIDFGSHLSLVPSVGYIFAEFNFEPALPNATTVQFLSTDTHAASLGALLNYETDTGLQLRAEIHGFMGITIESPYNLGRAGPGLGVTMSAGAGYRFDALVGVFFEYALTYRYAHYVGAAEVDPLDPTISTATLADFTQGVHLGVSMVFDGI
ncbi:MAG: hypothetical protein IPK13_17990 [Deltaproteobacteria bacterium]|nr:hypothetical protein [Deltaproteobacteria bacterium]